MVGLGYQVQLAIPSIHSVIDRAFASYKSAQHHPAVVSAAKDGAAAQEHSVASASTTSDPGTASSGTALADLSFLLNTGWG